MTRRVETKGERARGESPPARVSTLSPRLLGAALAVAAVAAVALVGASLLTGSAETTRAPSPGKSGIFAGIPQSGAFLGAPDAPVLLIEYADLQCPWCAVWSNDVLPKLVGEYVRSGKVRLEFRGLAFLGPDSDEALRATLAAGEQDKLWDFLHVLYARQGFENSGWVDQGLLRAVAQGSGVDAGSMLDASQARERDTEIAAAAAAATAAGVRGTPSFQVGPAGGPFELVQDGSFGSLSARIDALLP